MGSTVSDTGHTAAFTLCLFDDSTVVRNFYPLSLTHHVSELLVGTETIGARVRRAFGVRENVLHGRRYLVDYYRAKGRTEAPQRDRPVVLVNSRLSRGETVVAKRLNENEGDLILRNGETVVAARFSPASAGQLDWDGDTLRVESLGGIPTDEVENVSLYDFLWDLIYDNPEAIGHGALSCGGVHPVSPGAYQGVHFVAPERILLAADVRIMPGVVIDASHGPVILDEGATVMANAVIEGPCYIGAGSTVKIGAKIYEGSSFGPRCKIGGEIENSIFIGYSNKQHDGFLGHSYVGAWVNLGADTNTSDLKNNYGEIRATLNGEEVSTGRIFLGSLIGDHSKTGINTMLNTGTTIGLCSNVFGGGFPAKYIPSFQWGGSEGWEPFRLDKAIELAERVMARRNIPFEEADQRLLTYIHENSNPSIYNAT